MNKIKAEINQMHPANSSIEASKDTHSKNKPAMVKSNENKSALQKDEHIKDEKKQQDSLCDKMICFENNIKSALKKKRKKLSTNNTAKSKPKVKTKKEPLSTNSVSNLESETLKFPSENASKLLLSCQFCQKEFETLDHFKGHDCECIKSKSSAKMLKCKYCSLNFSKKKHLNEHLKGHKRNHCTFCDADFYRRKALCKHFRTAHNFVVPEKIYSCLFCKKEFSKKQFLVEHLKIHADGQHFCVKCGFMCDNENIYNEHMKDHIKSSKFECKFCGKTFARRQQYNQHMIGYQKHSCALCESTFSTKKLLQKHSSSVHGKPDYIAKNHVCPICEKRFIRPRVLQLHQRTHTGEKPLTCKVCNQSFPSTSSLSKHMKSVRHLQRVSIKEGKHIKIERNFQCGKCGVKYYGSRALFRHIDLVHSESEPFKCPHCQYSTKSKTNLKRHIDCHTDNKPFICEVCGASFRALATLKSHHAYVHSESRSFVCDTCNKSFKIKGSLLRHAKIHSQARPYKCCHCNNDYKRLSHLKRHMASAHRMTSKTDQVPVTTESENLRTNANEINSDALVESLDSLPDYSSEKDISLVIAPNSNISIKLEDSIIDENPEFLSSESPKHDQYSDVPSNIIQSLIDKIDIHSMPHNDLKSTLVTFVSSSSTKTSPIYVQTNHDSNSISLDDPNLNLSPSNLCNFNLSPSPSVIENWDSASQDKIFTPDAFAFSLPESLIQPHSKFQNQNLDSFAHFSLNHPEPQTSMQIPSFLLSGDISSPTHINDLNLGQNASSKHFFDDTDDILSHESGVQSNEVHSSPSEHIFSPSRGMELWDPVDNSNRVKLPSSELVSDKCGNAIFSTNLASNENNLLSHNLLFPSESLMVCSLDVNNLNPDFDSLSNLC